MEVVVDDKERSSWVTISKPNKIEILPKSTRVSAFVYDRTQSVDLTTTTIDGTRVSVSFEQEFLLKVAKAIRKQRITALRDYRDREGARTGIDLDKTHGDQDEIKRPTNDLTAEEADGL